MRIRTLVLAVLAGCSSGGSGTLSDPDLAKPCEKRRAASVVVGAGAEQFQTITADTKVLMETDPQGCAYVSLGVACRGMGPQVSVRFGVDAPDAGAGADAGADAGTSQDVTLVYESGSDTDQVAGLQAYIVPRCDFSAAQALVGATVTFWAEATDDRCNAGASGSATVGISGFDNALCAGCLYQQCGVELAACGPGCRSIQACLDARCVNLSANGLSDEGACQLHCQDLHAGDANAKQEHIALVKCVRASTCQPPCLGYSYDWDQCVTAQDTSSCADAKQACASSSACQAYQTCAGACTTLEGCLACASAPGGAKGESLFEAYQLCLENACIAQGWLPHLPTLN